MKPKPQPIKRLMLSTKCKEIRLISIQWRDDETLQWAMSEGSTYGQIIKVGNALHLYVSAVYDYDEVVEYLDSYNDDLPVEQVDMEIWGEALQ